MIVLVKSAFTALLGFFLASSKWSDYHREGSAHREVTEHVIMAVVMVTRPHLGK